MIGSEADAYKGGGGSSAINPFSFSSPRAEIARRAGRGVQVRYDPGDDPERAAAVARAADVAVVFASDTATEGVDKSTLATDDDALVEAVAAANPRTTVMLETAGPVLTPWRERVNAIVEAWYPGQAAGLAIARVLFGDVDPGRAASRHLPAPDGGRAGRGRPRGVPRRDRGQAQARACSSATATTTSAVSRRPTLRPWAVVHQRSPTAGCGSERGAGTRPR